MGWVDRPQQVGLRRALVQIHLWMALGLGLYVIVISLSGSAVVFRRELHRWLVPSDYAEAALPATAQVLEWLVDLHDNLLGGPTGRMINGLGAALLLVVLLTGVVLWWPGRSRWRQALALAGPVRSLRFARQLHSFAGFWAFTLLLLWALTAVYFAFPEVFEWLIDYADADPEDEHRPGELLLYQAVRLHFGRFGGWPVRTLWVVLGLLPAALFITGFLTWWKQGRPRAQRFGA